MFIFILLYNIEEESVFSEQIPNAFMYTYIMDYGVHIWTSIPFEYSPFAATLLVLLSTHFRLFQLSFDLSQKWLIKSALVLAELAP